MRDWINFNDRPPPAGETVLMYAFVGHDHFGNYYRKKKIYTAYYDPHNLGYGEIVVDCDCSGYEHDREYLEPICWMPLPGAPDETITNLVTKSAESLPT